MKLSQHTISVLENFSNINSNLVVKPGNIISTISEAKNILAIANLNESFDREFGIYDLKEFISVYNLITDPVLDFSESSVKISNQRCNASYRFADVSILTTPTKTIKMPDPFVKVNLTSGDLAQVGKAASVLKHTLFSIVCDEYGTAIKVYDPKNSASNAFSISLDCEPVTDKKCDLQFLISNLKLIPGDYEVEVASMNGNMISLWKKSTNDIQYFIALEKSSTQN